MRQSLRRECFALLVCPLVLGLMTGTAFGLHQTPGIIEPGDTISFSIPMSNASNIDDLHNVRLVLIGVPAGLTSRPTSILGPITLPPGESKTFRLDFQVNNALTSSNQQAEVVVEIKTDDNDTHASRFVWHFRTSNAFLTYSAECQDETGRSFGGALSPDKTSVWKKGDPLSYRPPRIFEAVVTASVTAQGNLYFYSYAVYNATRNPVALYRFELDLRAKPENHPFSLKDITVSHTPNDHDQALYKVDRVQPKETSGPVGWTFFEEQNFPVIPGVWSTNDAGAYGIVIKPGRMLAGFGLLAEEPPGIREYVVNAHDTAYDSWLQQQPPAMWDYYLKSEDLAAEQNQGIEYVGKTISPIPAPEKPDPENWIAHMQSLVTEARALGWIKSDKEKNSLLKALKDLPTKDAKALRAGLEKIAADVKKDKAAGELAEEAGALVRLNALYLVNRLD